MISSDNAKAIVILAVGVGAAYVVYRVVKGASAAGDALDELITEKLNPASENNFVYDALSEKDTSGQVTGTVGTDIYDAFHNSDGSFKWPWQSDKGLW